ncbi:MAG: class I SAM-dependent methyltransferase [Chloroflexota bacterium]
MMSKIEDGAAPPVIDYEGSDYQSTFWDAGKRDYEDQTEVIALKRLLPRSGKLMLEIGAGAGRNTQRYAGYDKIVVMDYSVTQLQQAQKRLGRGDEFIYVAADVYRLPFVAGLFDGATMIRVLHHIIDVPKALKLIRQVLQPQGIFILEYANKQNFKAIFRYLLRGQSWNPFTPEQIEFVDLNFNFHPKAIRKELQSADFNLERQLTVSHFRVNLIKRIVPTKLLVWLDSLVQFTGRWFQFSPSVFTRSQAVGNSPIALDGTFFRCPSCGEALREDSEAAYLESTCGKKWGIRDGIYNFKEAIQ